MRNYLKADLHRVLTKKSRIIFLSLCVAIGLVNILFMRGDSPVTTFNAISTSIEMLPLLLGLVEIPALFGDEFKAGSMQMAIGHGVSKRKVVHTKWMETFIIGIIDITAISLTVFLVGALLSSGIFKLNLVDLLIQYLISVLTFYLFIGITMFLLFGTQSTILGIIVFTLLNASIIPTVLSLVQTGLGLQKMRLDTYLLSTNLNLLQTQLELGNFSLRAILVIVVYFVIFFNLSVIVFKNKELDF